MLWCSTMDCLYYERLELGVLHDNVPYPSTYHHKNCSCLKLNECIVVILRAAAHRSSKSC